MTETEPISRTFHRLGSATQTPSDTAQQVASGEIWGRAPFGSFFAKVKAYPGPLPSGARGIEFVTTVPPDAGSHPARPEWSGPRPGVEIEGEFAKIRGSSPVVKNTQT